VPNSEFEVPSEAINARDNDGHCLRVDFIWRGDRYGHVISLIDVAGQPHPLLESIEGAPTDAWPPSPPLQSLSIETLTGGRRAALLVGSAGRSHWSASIEPSTDDAALHFDIACRHAATPHCLGSRYRWLSAAKNVSIRGLDAAVSQEGAAATIQPATIAATGGTTRWKFAIQLTSEFRPLSPFSAAS
jgi:hypothetical protein